MKIFRIKVTYETVIRAESQADAERYADRIIRDSDEIPTEVDANMISSISELPDGWDQNCMPWETGVTNGDIALGAMLSPENVEPTDRHEKE